jgi:hypothetical protein
METHGNGWKRPRPTLQAGGHWFDPSWLHQKYLQIELLSRNGAVRVVGRVKASELVESVWQGFVGPTSEPSTSLIAPVGDHAHEGFLRESSRR